jgi:ubiquinone biosynthesis accessory factor UbiJ
MQSTFGPTLRTGAIATLELLVNRALALDPASRRQLAALHGQVFHLECTSPELDLFVVLHADRVQLAVRWEGDITAALSGSGADYRELLASHDPGATLINGAMTLRGDSKALLRLRDIAAQLDIDWETPLTSLFGDVIGHQVARSLRFGQRLMRDALTSLSRQLHDYVQEESDWLAPRWEVEQFNCDVADVARRGELLADRIAQLQTKIQQRLARRAANKTNV